MAESTQEMRVSLPGMSMQARSLDIPTSKHPNKMPFSGVLTKIDEPSDAAPEGSKGKRVMLTMEAARQALDSLLGMGVNYNPEGHNPQEKIGVIMGSEIVGNEIHVNGFIYAADFPEVAIELKANKDKLGFSFEARDLMTTDVNADPVPICECIFTGAAILLKEKAAYKTTSLSAKAAEQEGIISMPLDKDVEKKFDEIAASVAAAVKPLADAIAAQAEQLKKLEDEKVEAANHLAKVEQHASELEKAADHMDAAGIGGDPDRGHVKVLRDMAGDLRANAAQGRLPAVFNRFYAAAEKVDVDGKVKEAVAKTSAEFTAKIDEVKAAAEKSEKDLKDKLASAETVIADFTKKAEATAADAVKPERKTVDTSSMTLMAKAGLAVPAEGKMDINKINEALKGMTIDQRFQVKASLHQAGLID